MKKFIQTTKLQLFYKKWHFFVIFQKKSIFAKNNTIMAYDVMKVANLLLQKAKRSANEGGELLTNLKLQKLLYYEQGFHLAYFGTPLFDEDIEAWQYGPAVPVVYSHFKQYGSSIIEPESDEKLELTDEERDLFEAVFREYNQYSAVGLMKKTHQEPPWNSVTPGRGQVITKRILKKYFKTRLE